MFVIVVVLLARGAIYIYDHNKDKIDNLVSRPGPVKVNDNAISEGSGPAVYDAEGKVISAYTLTFLLSGNNEIYYYVGDLNDNLSVIDYNTVGIFIKAYKNAVRPEDLMFIIKADNSSSFKNAIDILDEMQKNEVPAGHYAEEEITKEEIERIKLFKTTKNG